MEKHILFIIDGLPGGGAENITLTLAKGISQRGYQVTLLSLSKKLDYEIPTGVNYLTDCDEYKGKLRKISELARRATSLDHQLTSLFQKLGKPILVISSLHKTDRIVVRSKILQSCNVWHCVHGIFSRSYLGNKTGLSLWLKRKKIKKVYRNRNVIAVSDAVGTDLLENTGIQPSKLLTIYNPFNIKEIKKRASEANPFAGQDYILHVGRFHKVKCHDRLLTAFALADLPCKLVIIGQGEPSITKMIHEKITELKIQDKVILAGFSANPLPVIKGAKMVVLSSDSEGLPTVLIEALICHTPVVSTACPGGVKEIMTGNLERYQARLNEHSLAEKIVLAWQDPPIIEKKMYAKFDYELILDQYLGLIK